MTTKIENSTAMKDDERGLIVLEATWGISALVTLISNALENDDGEETVWATKEVLKRIGHLNSVIMTAVGDVGQTTEKLRARIN